eukprot:352980-Chlamydomonas_euryale.AAC.4
MDRCDTGVRSKILCMHWQIGWTAYRFGANDRRMTGPGHSLTSEPLSPFTGGGVTPSHLTTQLPDGAGRAKGGGHATAHRATLPHQRMSFTHPSHVRRATGTHVSRSLGRAIRREPTSVPPYHTCPSIYLSLS